LCFERCELGAGADPRECPGTQTACAPLDRSSDEGYCRPLCMADVDCPSGVCDARHGVCASDASPDTTFGLRCTSPASLAADPDQDAGTEPDDDSCVGVCVQLNGAPAQCSRPCAFGEAGECAPATGGLRRGACVFVTPGGSIGDLGYCAELCDCSEDCVEPTFVCDAFSDAVLSDSFGRKGICTDPALVLGEVLACKP
jgi:hypothetical protein